MRRALPLLALLWCSSAAAHTPGASGGEYRLQNGSLSIQLSFSKTELSGAFDRYRDGAALAAWLGIKAQIDGRDCSLAEPRGREEEEDGYLIRIQGRCEVERDGVLHIALGFIDRLPAGHRHFALGKAGGALIDVVTHRRQASLDIPVVLPLPWFRVHQAALIGALSGIVGLGLALFLWTRSRRSLPSPPS